MLEMRSGILQCGSLGMGRSITQAPKALEPFSMMKTDTP
jgi:hypothetical protein